MAASGPGRVFMFEDFFGVGKRIADTLDFMNIGAFLEAGGEGLETTNGGVVRQETDGLSGVVRLISDNTDADTTCLMTARMFDVALMGTIVMEVRVRLGDLDDKQIFIGFCDSNDPDMDATADILDGATGTTWTLQASNLVGFGWASQLTDDEDWHGVYNGGATTGQTDSALTDLNDDAVAGEWQVLRLELTLDGTARWYIDGVLVQTVTGAISTTTDLNFVAAVSANTSQPAEMDLDYVLIEANRDWTV